MNDLPMRNRQQGITLVGLVFLSTALVFVSIFAMKLVPAYIERYTIGKIFRQIVNNPAYANATAADVRAAFQRQVVIDSVKAITPSDLVVTREAGQLVVEARYEITIPLISNISLLVAFQPTSR